MSALWGGALYSKFATKPVGVFMATSFKEILETLVDRRIADGEDPRDLFEELLREANLVFGRYDLEYQMGLFNKAD